MRIRNDHLIKFEQFSYIFKLYQPQHLILYTQITPCDGIGQLISNLFIAVLQNGTFFGLTEFLNRYGFISEHMIKLGTIIENQMRNWFKNKKRDTRALTVESCEPKISKMAHPE